jgi:hypothetical protein
MYAPFGPSTCDVQDRVGVTWVPLEYLNGLGRRQDEQLNVTALGFELQIVHHRQSSRARANH